MSKLRDVRQALRWSAEEWMRGDVDLLAFDHRVHVAEDELGRDARIDILVEGEPPLAPHAQAQVALRYQRLWPEHNQNSAGPLFDAIRARHRELHRLDKPLVRADFEHSVDTWQWTLRVCPNASLELQVAALFHDIERLESEAEVRIEHQSRDYLSFKQRHAQRGAAIVRAALGHLSLGARLGRIEELVCRHEQPESDPELAWLNDADALSFFALNSAGFFRYYAPEHCARKVAYTLGRMSAAARGWLPAIRLERQVSSALASAQPGA